ncbi:MAG: LPS assembly lipoprotein LptE [Gammaproteobacteria bacterium]|nr:MAG: LPS assembly lipoprotein LptE [Gammaproteobacteria bacterium]
MKRFALIFLLTAGLLSGCGFHLRGTVVLPDSIRSVAISSPDGKLKDILADRLESNKVVVVANPTSDSAYIKIVSANFSREIKTIDERGKSTGYVLILKVGYQIFDSKGKALVKPSVSSARRDYNFDPDQLLSATREEELLRDEMRGDAAQGILRKISRIR